MWKKLGRVFSAQGQYSWMHTYATVPTPIHLQNDVWRIYFSTRNEAQRNQVGFVDIDLYQPNSIIQLSAKPVISHGPMGYFDADGVYATSIVRHDNALYFYYAGWNAGRDGAFYSAIGVAISRDNGNTFKKYTEAPVLGRDVVDKWSVMAPFVLKLSDDNWVMWYTSGISLSHDNHNGIQSLYDIKTAVSKDGLQWQKTGKTAIALGENDTNIARACVVNERDRFAAYYPYVTRSLGQYRIGYAESSDGFTFCRMDKLANGASLCISSESDDWDSQAVTYPYVFYHDGKRYMLYNGNQFGHTGFGLAVWE